eukprot:scaffold112818_cov75-Attheya_sp.AAC.1
MADDAVPEPIDLAPSDNDDDPEDDFEDPPSIASDNSTRSLADVQNQDWDDNSLDSNDTLYTYDPVPIVVRPDPSGYHSLYDAAVSEYDFMAYFSDEHFLRMKCIDYNSPGPNVPFAMSPVPLPIRDAVERPLITFQHERLPDPVFDHHLHVGPGVTNHEDMITLEDFAFREHDWMRSIECFDTYTVIDNLLNWPRAPNHGAPVDVHGFPMTHHYDSTDTLVPHGTAPAFYRINCDHPTRNIPSNL